MRTTDYLNKEPSVQPFLRQLSLAILLFCAPAAFACFQTDYPHIEVHEDAIRGLIATQGKPLMRVRVVLVDSHGEKMRTLIADQKGEFIMTRLLPGKYELQIEGWGKAAVTILSGERKYRQIHFREFADGCFSADSE
jgi:hypothetical protein